MRPGQKSIEKFHSSVQRISSRPCLKPFDSSLLLQPVFLLHLFLDPGFLKR
jgi:hypothetical protein